MSSPYRGRPRDGPHRAARGADQRRLADVLTGLNALLVPREFFESFPLGAALVAQLPPFNES